MSQQGQSAWLRKHAAGAEGSGFDLPAWTDAEVEPAGPVDIVPARPRGAAKRPDIPRVQILPTPVPPAGMAGAENPDTEGHRPEMPVAPSAEGPAERTEPSWADMLDPQAREARLAEARARRAEALARRSAGAPEEAAPAPIRPRGPGATVVRPVAARSPRPGLTPESLTPESLTPESTAPGPVAPPPLVADARPVPVPKPRPVLGGHRGSLAAIFLAGVLGGGIAVWLVPSAPGQRSAEAPSPGREVAAPVEVAVSLVAPTTMDEGPAALAPDAGAAPVGPGGVTAAPRAGEPGALSPPLVEAAPARPVAPAAAPDFTGAAPIELAGLAPEDHEALPNFARFAAAGGRTPAAPPAPGIEAPLPDAATRPAVAPSLAGAPAPAVGSLAGAPAPAVGTARVFVHFPPTAAAEADAALATLRAAGVGEATLVPGRVPVGTSNVRYFHEADREAALDVARLLAPSAGAVPEARDFTGFRPRPDSGLVEVWFAGEAPAAAAPAAAGRKTVAVAARAPATTPRVARQQEAEAEAVQRILLERAVERMLKDRMPRG